MTGVSESTVRRDLEILEEQGGIRRTHGGAVSLDGPASRMSFAERQPVAAAEKNAIAAVIASRIPDGQTVILDGGTTCLAVAAALRGRPLVVITHSVHIAALLAGEVNTEVTLIGGYLYPRTGVALGAKAVEMLGSLRAAQAVVSCAAVNPDGVFNVNEMMAAVERQIIDVADEVIVAADHSKFNKRSIARVCELDEIDALVTDWGADEQARSFLAAAGVNLVIAEQQA
jgi:DeoR/GlpR family transcriptional regulator of sugar metabolism